MELKEIKCKNCNASLEVEEKQKMVTCEYCHTKFSVEDEYSKAYDSTKGTLDAQFDSMNETFNKLGFKGFGKAFKLYNIIVFVIAILIFFGIIIGSLTSFSSFKKSSFNSHYESEAGRTAATVIRSTLDEIVTNNKTNKHKVEVSYGDKKCSDEECIHSIRDSLDAYEYNVSLDYSKSGYVVLYGISDLTVEETKKEYSSFDISFFNTTYESYAGKEHGVSVGYLCDKVVTNNKTGEHIITVSYNGVEGTDETTINSIRDSLEDWDSYNVSFDYDDIGFIVKANITVIE